MRWNSNELEEIYGSRGIKDVHFFFSQIFFSQWPQPKLLSASYEFIRPSMFTRNVHAKGTDVKCDQRRRAVLWWWMKNNRSSSCPRPLQSPYCDNTIHINHLSGLTYCGSSTCQLPTKESPSSTGWWLSPEMSTPQYLSAHSFVVDHSLGVINEAPLQALEIGSPW